MTMITSGLISLISERADIRVQGLLLAHSAAGLPFVNPADAREFAVVPRARNTAMRPQRTPLAQLSECSEA
ncbi:hypothetical protein [Mesorhizobium sp. M0977]|uniref:hypothetical protein n=1 Tax=Mesorhizobium sp. M0977 TaxID=2957039 RepID=UPI003334C62E